MAENTKIQWTDHTVNFWTGCIKVSPGCKYCYMFRDQERYKKKPTDVLQVAEKTINKVLRAAKPGDKIFTCSWSDFFIEEADQWRAWAWDIIRSRPDLNWQILTKRPERIIDNLPPDWGDGWPNVWLGVSVETQEQAYKVVQLLLVPAKIRFISLEPLIGPVDLTQIHWPPVGVTWHHVNALSSITTSRHLSESGEHLQPMTTEDFGRVDWVIIGGESGNDNGKYKYRPCQLGWIYDIIRQCRLEGVPAFFKQMGTSLAKYQGYKDRHGGGITEFPADLQVREFPVNMTRPNE